MKLSTISEVGKFMFKIRIRRLHSEEEFQQYNKDYIENGSFLPVDMGWMKRSKTTVVTYEGSYIGGFVECCPPERSLADMPDGLREEIIRRECGSMENVQENAAFWIKRKGLTRIQKSILQMVVWAALVFSAVFLTRSKYTVGVSNLTSIYNLYCRFQGRIIYSAPSKLVAGESYHVFLWKKSQFLSMIGMILIRFLTNQRQIKPNSEQLLQPEQMPVSHETELEVDRIITAKNNQPEHLG